MTKSEARRGDALQALYVKFPSGEMISRTDLAAAIRALAPLGRTERWQYAIESWALIVLDITANLVWAYQQYSVFAAYAI